jgi:hypothetical protein
MTTEIVTVTPDMAGDWLGLNTHNRPLRENWVYDLARRIDTGEWTLNGESIKFNGNGKLIDGQHRLTAVVMANKPITTVVVRGAPEDSFATIDGGRKRTIADAFALNGEANATLLASVVVMHWRYEHRVLIGRVIFPSSKAAMLHLEEHPGLRDAMRMGARTHDKVQCSISALGTAAYLFMQQDQDAAERFFETLATGTGLSAGDPIYRLRERFIANRAARMKASAPELLALTIKAWNFWRIGREISASTLMWRYRGGELFPEAQ